MHDCDDRDVGTFVFSWVRVCERRFVSFCSSALLRSPSVRCHLMAA